MRRVRFLFKLVNALLPTSCYILASFLAFSSCSETPDCRPLCQEKSTLYIRVQSSQDSDTKTMISGEHMDKVLWSEKDCITFCYGDENQTEAMAQSVLGVYRIYPGQALFTGEISAYADAYYTCYAVYPEPESIDGQTAVFSLPSTQNGLYDSSVDGESLDIMVAEPVSGAALADMDDALDMNFFHKCHAFRIQIPEDRNLWGADVKKLRVEFPVDVAGKLAVNMSDPSAAPVLSEGSNIVWLDLTKRLNESEEDSPEGMYAWLFTAPVAVDGEIRFTAYNDENYQSGSLAVSISKNLEAGKITPVNLTIPEELEHSSVRLKVVENHLGEDYQFLKVTAPDGARFRNGEQTMVFEKNDSDTYSLGFYKEIDGVDNLSPMKSGGLQVEFESEHAIVSGGSISLADFQWGAQDMSFDLTVPYLLYEDFSGAADHSGSNTSEFLDSYNLPGWSASNYELEAGTSARIHMYLGSSVAHTNERFGRLDSPVLSCLKDGTDVTISVSYDISGTKTSGINADMWALYSFGKDTRTEAIAYSESIQTPVIKEDNPGTDGSFTNITQNKTVEMQVTNADRLSWRTSYGLDIGILGTITAKTVYVYIDNIKVSIKND